MTRDWVQDVLDFHRKFNPRVIERLPGKINPKDRYTDKHFGFGFVKEEVRELEEAFEKGEIENVADSLADLIYVSIRMALIWGVDLRPVWEEVHRANMEKVGGEVRGDGKVLKPPNWRPPDIQGVLARQVPINVEKMEAQQERGGRDVE